MTFGVGRKINGKGSRHGMTKKSQFLKQSFERKRTFTTHFTNCDQVKQPFPLPSISHSLFDKLDELIKALPGNNNGRDEA